MNDRPPGDRMPRKVYEQELERLQLELVRLQEWVRHEGVRIAVLFEGRDVAGKGGAIKRIIERLNPRVCRIVAQERRFRGRITDVTRRWKLSQTDLESRSRWVDFSRAKEEMFVHTDTPESPWYVVEADDKRRARLNCIAHLLASVPCEERSPAPVMLPERQPDEGYRRPDRETYTYVPDHAASLG